MANVKYARKTIVFENGKAIGVQWNWTDGTTDRIMVDDISDPNRDYAACHGLKQRGGDAYASAETLVEAKAMFTQVKDHLESGSVEWTLKGTGLGGGTLFAEALARAAGKTLDEAIDKLAEMDEHERKALEQRPEIKLAKLEIQKERMEAKAATAPGLGITW